MTRLRACGGVLATCLCLGFSLRHGLLLGQDAPAPAATQTAPIFRGGVNYVLVDAYPQRGGRIVEGLKAEDFQILEDGKPQRIDGFEFVRVGARQPDSAYRDPNTVAEMNAAAADPHARVFVVYLDTAHTTVDGSNRIRVPLVRALNSIIGPADLFGAITQNQHARDLTLQRHVTSVEDQLSRYWTWGQSGQLIADQRDPLEEMLTSCFRVLQSKDPKEGAVPWMVADGASMRTLDLILIDRHREERLLASLADLIAHLGTLREARSVLLIVTDGWQLFTPNRALESQPFRDARFGRAVTPAVVPAAQPRRVTAVDPDQEFTRCVGELNHLVELDNAKVFRDIMVLAQRNNVSIYPVSSAGLQTVDVDVSRRVTPNPSNPIAGQDRLQVMERLGDRVRNLQSLAENTGGIAVVQNNDLEAGMRRIVDDVSASYLLGYYSTNANADGRFRKIDVKMKAPDVTVRARRGYVAMKSVARTPAAGAVEATRAGASTDAPVVAALADLARAREAEIYVRGTAQGDRVLVAVELGGRALASGDWAKGGAVTVTVSSEHGSTVGSGSSAIDPGGRGALVVVPVSAGDGSLKVSARVASGALSLSDRVDVPARRAGLLSAPVIYRATPSPRSPLSAAAVAEFRRGERLHAEWQAAAELDGRTARLLDRNGRPLPVGASITERFAEGAHIIAVDVNLAPLAEGDYVIELTTQKAAESGRDLVAFRVMR
jgi:VWFA-related protein